MSRQATIDVLRGYVGPYLHWRLGARAGMAIVMLTCPNGHTGPLTDHDIASDGTVTPRVVCAGEGCDFQGSIRLVGWVGRVSTALVAA